MPKKSNVWSYFTRLTVGNGDKGKCNICANEMDYKAGTTNMWRHFLKHYIHTVEKGIVQCIICQAKLKASAATSSQVVHVEECIKRGVVAVGASRPPTVQSRAPLSSGSLSPMDLEPANLGAQLPPMVSAPSRRGVSSSNGPDMDEPTKRLARMIVLHGYDPSIVDDDGFKSFVESLNPEYRVPKRVEIGDACELIFAEETSKQLRINDRYCWRNSLAVGKAKIMEREVVYTTEHLIDNDWNIHKVINRIFLDGLSPFPYGALDGDITQICIESRFVQAVGHCLGWSEITGFHSKYMLVAWGVTKDYSTLTSSINQNFGDMDPMVCIAADVMFHSIAEHLYLQIDEQFFKYKYSMGAFLTRKEQEIRSLFGLDLWACKEAWYSWYCYLVVLCSACPAADSVLTKLLCNIWREIYRAIQIISTPKLPTSNLCLLELCNVKKILESELALTRGGPTYADAFIDSKDATTVLTELINILDKYIKESYLVWFIPLVLDPRCNLARVKHIFRELFGEAAESYISKSTEHMKVLYSGLVRRKFFNEHQQEGAQRELDRYLKCVVNPTEGFDILDWWKVHGSHHYETVALLASCQASALRRRGTYKKRSS